MKYILLGQVCLDIYPRTGLVVPGCGILHNAYHLTQLGQTPLLITRIGSLEAEHFQRFFQANQTRVLEEEVVAPGHSAAIEVNVADSGEATMANYRPGVWQDFRLSAREEAVLAGASRLHLVLGRDLWPEFERLGGAGLLDRPLVSADFFDFRYYDLEQFTRYLAWLDLAFIGWKGGLDDPLLAEIRAVAAGRSALVVLTLGTRGIQVFDSRVPGPIQSHFFPVEPVPVLGNTNGCGDAFIAYFLAGYWPDQDLVRAVEQGKSGGALATRWRFALPDSAYLVVP